MMENILIHLSCVEEDAVTFFRMPASVSTETPTERELPYIKLNPRMTQYAGSGRPRRFHQGQAELGAGRGEEHVQDL
jgi:hypothetical protein